MIRQLEVIILAAAVLAAAVAPALAQDKGSVNAAPLPPLALFAVPLITLGLWWLLGHTSFGESVRASVSNPDLARMTGISPKLMSTAIWTIGGFLSAVCPEQVVLRHRRAPRPGRNAS